ncbi:MAG TPA: CHAT domain-containing protein [Trichocoleus sp.]|jgi:CHAT domain-containing protein
MSLLFALGWTQISDRLFDSAAIAQAPHAEQWMQQGVDRYEAGLLTEAINNWQQALTLYRSAHNLEQTAVALENLARAYQALGQSSEELQFWEQASSVYQQLGERLSLGRVLVEQAQAYSRVGQYRRAIVLLCAPPSEKDCRETSVLGITRSLPQRDLIGEVAALGSLGDAYRLQGNAERAIAYLNQGLNVARAINQPAYLISMLNSLGNAHHSLAQLNFRRALSARQIEEKQDAEAFDLRAKEHDAKALAYLNESLTLAQTNQDQVSALRALVSALPAYYRSGDRSFEQDEWINPLQQAISIASFVPNSQEKVYALIDLVRFVQRINSSTAVSRRQCSSQTKNLQAERLLEQAIAAAQEIGNPRAESFALGELGHLYECQANYEQALELTRQAQLAAEGLEARDSAYLWQWQLGRILKAKADPLKAIAAYEEALLTLQALRKDILTASQDIQFDFRETVEPIYRELVELRLQQESPSVLREVDRDQKTNQGNITLALNTLDNLKLAELQNYFGNDCVLTALNPVDINFASNTEQTAILNTVVLDNRVAVILSIPIQQPDGSEKTIQQFEWVSEQNGEKVNQESLVAVINEYRKGLERVRDAIPGAPLGGYDPTLAVQIYNWLVRPFAPLLQQYDIKTLVFVQDGILRSVPMAALYDGEAFLIEKYAIAITPSINLTNLERADRSRLRALAVGLTESATVNGTTFPPLRYVASELEAVQKLLPRSVELRDQNFTLQQLKQALAADSYPIIHIATHGKFSAEADGTFLVTGYNPAQPDQRLTLNVLDDIIRQMIARSPLELLVLSACQTATGDDRAALGLAGIAAQAGAKRVLASLWSVNDQATTELITQFYQGISNPALTKAQALQSAQKALINSGDRTAHPAFWSAFVLIGNWL